MPQAIGRHRWVIAEGYIPPGSMPGADEALVSHEAACILNTSDREAHVEITIYFSDREPAGPYRATVGPQRTSHLRFNDLEDPEPVPPGRDYACLIESDVPVVVQHTRLDSRAAEISLMTTIAYPVD